MNGSGTQGIPRARMGNPPDHEDFNLVMFLFAHSLTSVFLPFSSRSLR